MGYKYTPEEIGELNHQLDELRAALRPFAEIARRLEWDKFGPDDPEWNEHVMEAPAEDIAPGAAYCLFVAAFANAAKLLSPYGQSSVKDDGR